MLNLADFLLYARIAEGRGDRVALRCPEGDFSYREVGDLADRFAAALLREGVRPEQRVMIALPDGPAFVGALFGVLKAGAVVVMVNPHLKADEIAYLYEHTRAPVVLLTPEHSDPFVEAARGASHLRTVVDDVDRWLDESAGDRRVEMARTDPDDAALWLFSGGTTGRPKAVVQSHQSFRNTTELYGQRALGLTEADITLSVPKLFFGYATGSNLFFPFSVGASAVLFPDRATPDAIFEQVARHRPTVLINVPTMVNAMISHPEAAAHDLSCLRLSTSAGEALPVGLHAQWDETFGVPLLDGLGTAEMWHIFVSNLPTDVRPGTLGRAVEGFDVRARDDEGVDVAVGEVGSLWVRGDSRAIGYWHDREKSRSAFRGRWYVSSDLISIDDDGYVTYHGRGDDLMKVHGKWVAPAEVEGCLLMHGEVRECAVVGFSDDKGLIKPRAFVVADSPSTSLGEDLLAYASERLSAYKRPMEITFLDELPRTHLGKVARARLRER